MPISESPLNASAVPPPQAPHVNGQVDRVQELLTEPLTDGYRPSLPNWALYITDALPQIWLLRDIELMLIHPVVSNALEYFKAGISGAEFWGGPNPEDSQDAKGIPICPENPEVETFVRNQCQLFWDRGVPRLQGGYEYGWQAVENMYSEAGTLHWTGVRDFSPRDTFILTQEDHPIGVRVKGMHGKKGAVDLWFASPDIPAKALWYAHNPRWQQFYGRSQLMAAWRPWRRLAWKDAAETVTDMGVYRFAYSGPVIGYPDEQLQTAQQGVPATTLDSQGNPRRWARDAARQMAEWMKAGSGIGLPTTCYPTGSGGEGKPKWTAEFPKQVLSVEGLIKYIQYLCDEIYYGIHIPPETIKASETGSGYSGRSIPIEAFMMVQQRIADQMLMLFIEQVLKPLVRWNWGPSIKWQVMVKPLMMSKRALQAGPDAKGGSMEQRTMPNPAESQTPGAGPGAHEQPAQAGWGALETGGQFSLNYMTAIERCREIAKRIHARAA